MGTFVQCAAFIDALALALVGVAEAVGVNFKRTVINFGVLFGR